MSRRKYKPASGGIKQCSQCKEELPVSRFPKNERMVDGYFHRCSTCIVANNKAMALAPGGNEYPFPTRNCPRCKMDVSIENWSKDSGARYGLGTYCKPCAAQRLAERRVIDPMLKIMAREKRKQDAMSRVKYKGARPSEEKRQRALESQRRGRLLLYGCEASFNEVCSAQSGLCLICDKELNLNTDRYGKLDKATIDHCHNSTKFRGLLCGACNSGLGFFSDNWHVLRRAADYVEYFSGES